MAMQEAPDRAETGRLAGEIIKNGSAQINPQRPLAVVAAITGWILAWLFSSLANAQGPPIHTDTAIISGLEGVAVRSFFESTQKSGSLAGGSEAELSVFAVPVIIPYEAIPNRLLVVGMFPYLNKRQNVQNGPTLSTSGLGDLRLMAKYLVWQKDALKQTTRMTLTGGIKLPTGEADEPGIPAPLQLGTGSVDYTVGATLTHVRDRFGVNSDLLYTFNTEANDFEFGDTLQYNLALGVRLLPAVYKTYPMKQVNLYLEFNGLYAQKSRMNGGTLTDSGGNTIFVSPGIQFIPARTVLLEASVQVPIVEDLNGSQLKTDYILNVGFRWLLF